MTINETVTRAIDLIACRPVLGTAGFFRPIVAALAVSISFALGSIAPAADYLKGEALQRQLDTPVALLQWGGNPLRNALNGLSESQQVAVFLDRRVDPDQLVSFSAQGQPLEQVFQRLAAQLRIGVCQVGPVIYLGPAETADVLATVVELRRDELGELSPSLQSQLMPSRSISWPELATPRDLMTLAARRVQLEIVGIDQIPHDIWTAADLPDLDFVEQMSLLLAGFGLTFQMSPTGQQLTIQPLPAKASLVRSYPMPSNVATRIAALLRDRFPKAMVRRTSDGLTVTGGAAAHRSIERWQSGRPAGGSTRPKPVVGETRYTLKIENQPAGPVARSLATKLGLEIQFAAGTEAAQNTLVSFSVENVTREALLEAVLNPAGLSAKIVDGVVSVLAVDR